jgi:hypothetical protein
LVFLAGSRSYADFVFQLGNHPQTNEANILFGAKETGNPVSGEIDHLGILANFSSTTENNLVQNAKGQANISSGDTDGVINNITITVGPGYQNWNDLIVNLLNGSGTATVTVNGLDANGNAESEDFQMDLGNGENFFTLTATNGETITSVTVNAADGFNNFKQPRVSSSSVAPIPEPASMATFGIGALALAGLGWLGVGGRNRDKN